jgi:hypothetical protein
VTIYILVADVVSFMRIAMLVYKELVVKGVVSLEAFIQ